MRGEALDMGPQAVDRKVSRPSIEGVVCGVIDSMAALGGLGAAIFLPLPCICHLKYLYLRFAES